MSFDGSCSKNGSGAGIWVHNIQSNHAEGHSYKIHFQCTNNIAEYEALLLGLKLLKNLGAKRITVHGDSKLIIKQVNGEYTTKHPRLQAYRDDVVDLLKTFIEYELNFVPRNQNILANGLAFAASTCIKPYERKQYTVQVKYRPAVPENIKYSQMFEGDKQIEYFVQSRNGFEMPNSDSDYEEDCPTEEKYYEE